MGEWDGWMDRENLSEKSICLCRLNSETVTAGKVTFRYFSVCQILFQALFLDSSSRLMSQTLQAC